MPIVTLADAANYVRTSKATKLLLNLLRSVERLFTFSEERYNRVSRYIAVVDDYKKGVPIAQITEKYGCTKRTVYDYVHRAGVMPRSFKPADVRKAVIRDYKSGIKVATIAALNNVSVRYVAKVVKDAGLSRNRKR